MQLHDVYSKPVFALPGSEESALDVACLFPPAAVDLAEVFQAPHTINELERELENQPELVDAFRRFASTSLIGLQRPASSLRRAILTLGLHSARSVASCLALLQSLRRPGSTDLDWCWRRSVLNAVAAHRLARFLPSVSPDDAVIAGLTQDVGMISLTLLYGSAYSSVVDRHVCGGEPLARAEQEAFGVHHADVSSELARRWGLPDAIVQAVADHHRITNSRLAVTLSAAEAVSNLLQHCSPQNLLSFRRAVEPLGIGPAAGNELLHVLWPVAQELATLFDVELSDEIQFRQQLHEAQEELVFEATNELPTAAPHRRGDRLTPRRHSQEERDELAGLANTEPFALEALLARTAARARQRATTFTLMLCEPGCACGGVELTQDAIATVREQTRENDDLVVSHSDRQFAILALGLSCDDARAMAARLREALVAQLSGRCGDPASFGANFGIITVPGLRDVPAARIIHLAESCLKDAASKGLNRVCFTCL